MVTDEGPGSSFTNGLTDDEDDDGEDDDGDGIFGTGSASPLACASISGTTAISNWSSKSFATDALYLLTASFPSCAAFLAKSESFRRIRL